MESVVLENVFSTITELFVGDKVRFYDGSSRCSGVVREIMVDNSGRATRDHRVSVSLIKHDSNGLVVVPAENLISFDE